MIAGVINTCGAFGGNMAIDNSNKRGMFENTRIKDTLVKPYLLRMGGDAEGQYPLPRQIHVPLTWKNEVLTVMNKEGYSKGQWMYKDSRMALMWQVWNKAFPDAKWLIVRRRTADIIHSCTRTAFMKAFKGTGYQLINAKDENEAWLWWVHQYEKKFVEMIEAGLNCKIIWPERMVDGDYKQLYETLEWLGLEWNPEALNFINVLLWGNKQKRKEITYGTNNIG
jgi:hypothetical protein